MLETGNQEIAEQKPHKLNRHDDGPQHIFSLLLIHFRDHSDEGIETCKQDSEKYWYEDEDFEGFFHRFNL